jgi:AcrR family transcriptional regulator
MPAALGGPRAADDEDETEQPAEPATARSRRPYLRAAERRARIIEAAQEVFARSNLQGARTRDIAKAADINQATLFEHFESKEALFHEAVVLPLLEAMRGMQERAQAYQAAGSRSELLGLAEASSARHLEAFLPIFPLLTASLFSDAELGRKLYEEQIAPILKQRGDVLAGLLREDLDPEFAGLALFGIMFAIAMDQTFKGRTGDVEELGSQLARFGALGFLKDSYKD